MDEQAEQNGIDCTTGSLIQNRLDYRGANIELGLDESALCRLAVELLLVAL